YVGEQQPLGVDTSPKPTTNDRMSYNVTAPLNRPPSRPASAPSSNERARSGSSGDAEPTRGRKPSSRGRNPDGSRPAEPYAARSRSSLNEAESATRASHETPTLGYVVPALAASKWSWRTAAVTNTRSRRPMFPWK